MNGRRSFIKSAGIFGFVSLLSGENLFSASNTNAMTMGPGILLNEDDGEIWYIGQRKAQLTIMVSRKFHQFASMSLINEIVIPGDGVPVHKHSNEDEFIFVHSGKLALNIGEKVQEVGPGALAFIPKKVWHGVTNVGNEDARFYAGYSPAGFEDYFRAIGVKSKEQSLNLTSDDWQRINRNYGVVYQ
jgi:quercetin dioxygenase-like cupin family protein